MRRSLPLLLLTLALALGVSHCYAAENSWDQATLARATDVFHRLQSSSWYKLELLGGTAGYASVESAAVTEDGLPKFRVTERMVIHVELAGQSLSARSDSVVTYGPDLRPENWVSSQDEFGKVSGSHATLTGNQLEIVTDDTDNPTRQVIQVGPNFGSELRFSVAILEGKLQVGQSYDLETFVPEITAVDQQTINVVGRENLTVGDQQVSGFKLMCHSSKLGADIVSWLDDKGDLVREELPGLMGLVMSRVTEQEALASFSPLKVNPAIPVGGTVDAPETLTYVRLRATGKAEPAAELIAVSPRVTVTPREGNEAQVEITAAQAPAQSSTLPISDPALAAYLQPSELAQSDDPQIVALARQIVGGEPDSWKAAQLIAQWVYNHLQKVKSEPRPISAKEILDQMSGDCSEHAILTVTLCRAAGIPARMISGVAWVGDSFWYHAWVEVYVGQWVEMDPTWDETLVDAGHLRLGETALDKDSFIQMALATGRTIGALELKVEEQR